jgi:guanylate kinase
VTHRRAEVHFTALRGKGKNIDSSDVLSRDTQAVDTEKYKEDTYIFVLPPSVEILKKRLEERMTDSKEEIEKRLKRAVSEIKTYTEYDYVIINDVFEDSLREFQAIVISQRVRTKMVDPLWIEKSFLKNRRSRNGYNFSAD